MSVDWDRIESFIGYGRIDAPVVFIGMEEGLADEGALPAELALRSQFQPVMDLEESQRGVVGGEVLFSDSPPRQPTWRVMADVMLHFEGETFTEAAERSSARKTYRAKRLGRSDGNSLLIELMPYPNPKISTWLYPERFDTRDEYVAAIRPRRFELLAEVLSSSPRRAIVCYGKTDWPNYKMLFGDVSWTSDERFECAEWRGVPITLTEHFSRFFNSDEQLDSLYKAALRSA